MIKEPFPQKKKFEHNSKNISDWNIRRKRVGILWLAERGRERLMEMRERGRETERERERERGGERRRMREMVRE